MSKVAEAYNEELEALFEEEYKELCFSQPVWNHAFNKKMVIEITQDHL